MDLRKKFTICGLFYGDYPQLAKRLLDSWLRVCPSGCTPYEFRIGLNSVSEQTKSLVEVVGVELANRGAVVRVFDDSSTTYKYPRMRQMFHEIPLVTPYTMWFDDDSCFAPNCDPGIFFDYDVALRDATQIGSIWKFKLSDQQRGIVQELGYSCPSRQVSFITGGWWVVWTLAIYELNWPIPQLQHRSGDVLFSVAAKNKGYEIAKETRGVWINADDTGRCSSARRRGAELPAFAGL